MRRKTEELSFCVQEKKEKSVCLKGVSNHNGNFFINENKSQELRGERGGGGGQRQMFLSLHFIK